MSDIKFVPFVVNISVGFWAYLARKKLEEFKLDDGEIPIKATYTLNSAKPSSPPRLLVTEECLYDVDSVKGSQKVAFVTGTLKLFNTIEEFKSLDRKAILNDIKVQCLEALSRNDLNSFMSALSMKIFAFGNLKKHYFHYHVLVPVIFDSSRSYLLKGFEANEDISNIYSDDIWSESGEDILYKDPLSQDFAANFLGWHLRNCLFWTFHGDNNDYPSKVKVKGRVNFEIEPVNTSNETEEVYVTGWEKYSTGGPAFIDLSALMDTKKLAKEASDLNLKLIKWRLVPQLNLNIFESSQVLLFGAGTLGCNVARLLLAWGFRHLTFVDNGKVSFSNPPRQSLYRHEDCCSKANNKAMIAVERTLEIAPYATVKGVDIKIPMPGHVILNEQDCRSDVENITDLIKEHDVLFLLTDSRESRWIPSLLGAAHDKIVITIALGFDSYVAMRHGCRENELGCYFCADVTTPTDSLSNRSLDQQCTVTRPGVSYMASAVGVELLASLLQHPLGKAAPSITATTPFEISQCDPSVKSLLGVVPHQIRGFISHQQVLQLNGQASIHCHACSENVVNEYRTGGVDFIMKALSEDGFLSSLNGSNLITHEEVELEIIGDDEDGFSAL